VGIPVHRLEETSIEGKVAQLHKHGYVIIPSLLSSNLIERLKSALAPFLRGMQLGRNNFEGFRTERVYALLAKAPVVAELVEHPRVLALLDQLLTPNYLLSANLAIQLYPGESRQPLHFDDGFYQVPWPRRAYGVSAIWAIDEFTTDNGSTEIIPGSHFWGEERPAEDDPRIEAMVMPAGSVLVFMGTLWHRGGANHSGAPRLAITPQYCEPWLRQIEQQIVAVPRDVAARYSVRIQALLGYSIHPPFMGYVDGMHPRRLIDPSYAARHAAVEEAHEEQS
jgi:ectoine hydroxylase-related dioxygenase (phytanoyl-CoA dioxygenase family)